MVVVVRSVHSVLAAAAAAAASSRAADTLASGAPVHAEHWRTKQHIQLGKCRFASGRGGFGPAKAAPELGITASLDHA